jgi:hypothetical protein
VREREGGERGRSREREKERERKGGERKREEEERERVRAGWTRGATHTVSSLFQTARPTNSAGVGVEDWTPWVI